MHDAAKIRQASEEEWRNSTLRRAVVTGPWSALQLAYVTDLNPPILGTEAATRAATTDHEWCNRNRNTQFGGVRMVSRATSLQVNLVCMMSLCDHEASNGLGSGLGGEARSYACMNRSNSSSCPAPAARHSPNGRSFCSEYLTVLRGTQAMG